MYRCDLENVVALVIVYSYFSVCTISAAPEEIPPIRDVNSVSETDNSFGQTHIKAEMGDPNAQNSLGLMYAKGQGVEQDYKEAAKWFTKAAEQGYPDAQNNLGWMYVNGDGVEQDYKEAVKWFTKAAEQGYPDAQNNLGVMYAKGLGFEQDYKEAVKWFTKAAEQGYPDAQNNLGWMYAQGQGFEQDYKEAVKWYTKAVEQEYPDAQNNLGVMYAQGQGVEQDYKEAAKWFTKAAEQGNPVAQNNLMDLYLKSPNPGFLSPLRGEGRELLVKATEKKIPISEKLLKQELLFNNPTLDRLMSLLLCSAISFFLTAALYLLYKRQKNLQKTPSGMNFQEKS